MPSNLPPKLFKLTPDLYSWYLRALLVAAYLNHLDRAKAHATGRPLAQIYRNLGLRTFYAQVGANSLARRRAALAALQVFYDRETRGSNLSAQVSRWTNKGARRSIPQAAVRVLTHYCLLNSETLMKLETSLYLATADRTEPVVPIHLELAAINAHELRELIELVAHIEVEEAALREKKPRKPRTPDTQETKARKRASALARAERARQASVPLPLAA